MARGRGSDEQLYGEGSRRQIETQLAAHGEAIDARVAELEAEVGRLRTERANIDDALASLRRNQAPAAPRRAAGRRAAPRRAAGRRAAVATEKPARAPRAAGRPRKRRARTAAIPLEQRMQQIAELVKEAPLTPIEIAKQVGATPQRVRQILPDMVRAKMIVAGEKTENGRSKRVYSAT